MADRDDTPPPVYGEDDQRAPRQRRPSEERVENAVESVISLIQAVRSWDQPVGADDKPWRPSRQAHTRLRHIAKEVLWADDRWRREHPEEPA